jgi:hypothetical protein
MVESLVVQSLCLWTGNAAGDFRLFTVMILGDKVLPNMVLLGREQERW